MIELSILELLYLVLTFFLVIIGTLVILILLRLLKILAVGVEIANYYWQIKKFISYYSQFPFALKDAIFDQIASRKKSEDISKEESKDSVL